MYTVLNVCVNGVAWHTPVRTCVRLKIEIQNLEKAKKLKNAIQIFVKWRVRGKVMNMFISF